MHGESSAKFIRVGEDVIPKGIEMAENKKPELREKWLFVSSIPLLYNKDSVRKQMEMEIVFMDKERPMMIKDVETTETLMRAMQELKIQPLLMLSPEQLKHDIEAKGAYVV